MYVYDSAIISKAIQRRRAIKPFTPLIYIHTYIYISKQVATAFKRDIHLCVCMCVCVCVCVCGGLKGLKPADN